MKGQAPSYWITPGTLIRGLFEEGSDEQTLLSLAACNTIELHADKTLWNTILWLLVNNLKIEDKPIITGKELGELRAHLPVVFH